MYESLEAELHDVFWEAEGPAAELPLLRTFLDTYPSRALEIGCGSGRLLFPLLQECYEVAGLDNSAAMIALAKEQAASLRLQPALFHEELSLHKPAEHYSAITVPAFSLQLFENPALALEDCARLLASGGGLYLTVFYPFAEEDGDLPENERYLDHELTLADGSLAKIETEHRLDRENLTLHRKHRYTLRASDGKTREHRSQQQIRYAEPDEWGALLSKTGFEITAEFTDFSAQEPEGDLSAGVTTFFAKKR